ncbi:MAG: enoyl-CoA hydratase/isomerase family protein [Betaproteobacteria bacterium]|nr:enoyl-CoA hydratase/isomerase family protein [Betaproteobacteria bacterium]
MSHCSEVIAEVRGHVGCITLNRPQALNALSLAMIRAITAALRAWQRDVGVVAIAIRGVGKSAPFGHFCAGGDIRFFHRAALSGDAELDDFFTEEYALNHFIHRFEKPVVVLLDGIVMGGGMGLAQGATHRVVTENSRLAMPETLIGLFPDVGGGYFLSRLKGHLGEWLALTGTVVGAATAIKIGWADRYVPSHRLAQLWEALAQANLAGEGGLSECLAEFEEPVVPVDPALDSLMDPSTGPTITALIDRCFGQPTVSEIVATLASTDHPWAKTTLEALAKRSPLMLHVAFEQIRRARGMTLADELRMERDLVRHCFHLHHLNRRAGQTETAEGIRALAIDKDHHPRWEPAALTEVTAEMVDPFFVSPWPSWAHPLRELRD